MKVNALQIRQSLGKILTKLKQTKNPIIIEKGRQPVAVLISMEMFKERFIDYQDQKTRDEILVLFKKSVVSSKRDSTTLLRELRYGSGR